MPYIQIQMWPVTTETLVWIVSSSSHLSSPDLMVSCTMYFRNTWSYSHQISIMKSWLSFQNVSINRIYTQNLWIPLRKDFSYRKLQDTKNYSKGNFQPSVGSVRDRAMRRKSFLSDWRYYEIIIMKSKRKNALIFVSIPFGKNTNPLGKNFVQICRALTSNTTLRIVSITGFTPPSLKIKFSLKK